MKQRVALISLTLLGTAAAYLVVTMLAAAIGWAVAHADTGPTPPLDATSAIAKYGWVGGVLIAYVAARWFVQKNATEHWIAQGRALSVVTAVLSVVGSVIGWRLGMDPDTIGFAAIGAIPLAIPSTVAPRQPPTTASGEIDGGTR